MNFGMRSTSSECGKIENEPSDKMNAESGVKYEIASGEKGNGWGKRGKAKGLKRGKDQGQWKVEKREEEGKQASKDREHKVCAGNAERKQRCQTREGRAGLHISRVRVREQAGRHTEGQ
ncbi:hypothetical protein WR25_14712 [Diploscapter pachys]|uniref:Uncharacterized protein n=1 Tax=Diploscapter pachys TaxID=2018661 RepID=A0A2A2J9N7_9BILA|nr:hypothetical protein WR25_14712 [Diploscapter pachys]